MRRVKEEPSSKGSIGAIFAILLGSGVLIGLIGLAFDAGIAYQEQQTLRIASSAAAKGLATKCSTGQPQCANQVSASALAQQLLNLNSKDGQSALDEVCGSAPLATCSPLSTRGQDCKTVAAGTNYARVTAKTQSPAGTTISSVFAQLTGGPGQPAFQSQLWFCSQATWTTTAQTSENIYFNMLMPACQYPGSTNAFVTHEFISQGNSPAIPREESCTLQVGGSGQTVSLANVMRGFAPFAASVGSCSISVNIAINSIQVLDGQTKKYCGGSVGSIGPFLNTAISNATVIPVALGGQISSPQANQWNISVAGFAGYRFLGYRISNSIQGGAVPPGGWSSYPAGVANNAKCSANRACFYGYYAQPPSFLLSTIAVKLIE